MQEEALACGAYNPHPIHTHTHNLGTQAPSEKTWLMSLPCRKKQAHSQPLGPANLLAEALLRTGLMRLNHFYGAVCANASPQVVHSKTGCRNSQKKHLIQARNGRDSLEKAIA